MSEAPEHPHPKPPRPRHRRDQALAFIAARGVAGGTWKEFSEASGIHHGSATGALSTLHKEGQISRLAEGKREGCSVYVLTALVGSRPTRAYGRSAGPTLDEHWQIGYDAAMAEVAERPNLELAISDALSNGIARGRIQEAENLLRLVMEMRRAIKGRHRAVPMHTRGCWMDHPDCALQSVEKALLKTVPPPRRIVRHEEADDIAV